MFIIGNLLRSLAWLTNAVLYTLSIIIIVNALLSWVRPDPRNPIVQFLDRVSDLVCAPIRRLVPTVFGGLDVAPILALLVIMFLQQFVVASLRGLADRLG